jgi:manganese-dependent inorganic pyrophosphatase
LFYPGGSLLPGFLKGKLMDKDMKRPVWVIGHKNPDTDSVCAAISYAYLKNRTDPDNLYIPMKAGSLNAETAFVLNHFHVPEPDTVTDVSTQIRDIEFRKTAGIDDHYSLKKAWKHMQDLDVVTLPVVNSDGFLKGIIVNGDIAKSYMSVIDNRILGRARTQYKNIEETLNAHIISGNGHGYVTKGKVVVASGSHQTIQNEIEEDDIVILGDVQDRQLLALEKRPCCMIVTNSGQTDVDPEVVAKAGAAECVLMTTEYDSFTAARLINQSMPIRYFMTKDHLVTFNLDDTVDEVQERMAKIRHRDFPVLDDKHKYVGMFSRRNLLDAGRKRLILVDHNERTQAVDGIDEAEILEIIDHHRLGSLETIQPIFFRNQPLGCSSTIIYNMFIEKNVIIPKEIAGLMLSAILSDTLMFRSPTCTDTDRKAAESLSKICGENIEELAYREFEAGSDFNGKTAEEIFYTDFKIFYSGETVFGVSQISAVSGKQLEKIKDDIRLCLNKAISDKGLSMVFVMLTDIIDQSTELLASGKNADSAAADAFGAEKRIAECDFILPGVVSRKKQLVPPIIESIQKEEQ